MKLCLNMIVKNEAKILERALASCAPAIAHYVIADTGSTDGTPELIARVFDARGIPGEVHRIGFANFEQARNEALTLARASAAKFDYVLLCDADMELVIEDAAFVERLGAPAYLVKQVAGISYDNIRLVRRDHPAKYVGATHEYLDVGPVKPRLEGIWFKDHAEGSSRAEKYERDERLLLAALEQAPNDARSMFYLAQTYKDLARYDDAIAWYEKRIAAGGWDEERWYARYMVAKCHLMAGHEVAFVDAALVAYDARPSRAEPLYLLAKHYRLKQQHRVALLFAEKGAALPRPNDSLFVEDFVYRFGLAEEISISGFYSPDQAWKERGQAACLRLAADPEAPALVRETAQKNVGFYEKLRLPNAARE